MSENNDVMHLINQARAQAKHDQWKNIFTGKRAMNLLVILIVLAVGFFVYKAYSDSQKAKYSEIFQQSLLDQQAGDMEKAKEGLKKIYDTKSAPSGVRSLAAIRYAAFLLDGGDRDGAVKIYLEINECRSCDAYVSDLAGLLAIKFWASDETEVAKDDFLARVEKIEHRAKALKYLISEQRAFLEMQKGNLEKSYEIFDLIAKSKESSKALKSRAQDGMAIVISKGFEPKTISEIEEKSEAKSEEKSSEKN